MIRSMTGFARPQASLDVGDLAWELRCVNHRYLEVNSRLGEEFRDLENAVRERMRNTLGRGKCEATLRFQPAPDQSSEIVVNERRMQGLLAAVERVEERLHNPARITALDVLQWPGVTDEPTRDLGEARERALTLLDEGLAELVANREREGERIREMIESRCASIEQLVARVRERRPQVLQAIREKLVARIEQLDATPDEGRLEQELAFVAQKMDVEEELDRLLTHLEEVRHALQREEAVGRRLDFLMQELNREANTLSAKSADADTTRAAVETKVLIEQMREQVQNVE